MSKEPKGYMEVSKSHSKNRLVIGIAVVAFALLFAFSVYKWVILGIRQPIEIFINLMFAYVLIERAQAKYYCELDKKVLRFTKKSLLGGQIYEIPYKDIVGIYRYKPKLLNVIKFRRSYRLNSALDNRPVWILAYRAQGSKGRTENRRIFFKASDELLDFLAEKLPNRVRVKEEQIILEMVEK